MIEGVSPDLPHTDRLPAPKEWGLRLTRPLVRLGLRLSWRVTVHGAQHVPRSGPVILAANHIGILDGPALLALTRRLTFALVKREAFTGAVGQFLALRRSDFPQPSRDRSAGHPEGDSGAASRQGAGGLPRRRTQWRRGRLGEGEVLPTWPWSRVRLLSRWPFSALGNLVRTRTRCLGCGDRFIWSTESLSPCPELRGRAARQQSRSGPRSSGSGWPITWSLRRR